MATSADDNDEGDLYNDVLTTTNLKLTVMSVSVLMVSAGLFIAAERQPEVTVEQMPSWAL